jgi:hypothetical protein
MFLFILVTIIAFVLEKQFLLEYWPPVATPFTLPSLDQELPSRIELVLRHRTTSIYAQSHRYSPRYAACKESIGQSTYQRLKTIHHDHLPHSSIALSSAMAWYTVTFDWCSQGFLALSKRKLSEMTAFGKESGTTSSAYLWMCSYFLQSFTENFGRS